MPKAKVNDIQIYYEVYGNGSPLVLIEGLSYSTWMWFKQIPEFSRHFQVIVFDNRGSGKTDKPDILYTIRLFADDTAGLLRSLGIGRAHILGYSMGGVIAQQLTLDHPEMVHALILCSTFLAGPHAIAMPADILKELQNIEELTQEQIIRKNMALAYTREYLREHQEEFDQMVAWRLKDNQPPYPYLRQLAAATNLNIEDRLGEIRNPTLILHGDLDNIVPAENARIIAKAIPQAQLIIYEGVSHHLFTAKAEDLNKDVIKFLKGLI